MEIPWKTAPSEKKLLKPIIMADWKNHTQKTIHDQTTKSLVVVDFLRNASTPPSFSSSSSLLFSFFLRGADLLKAAGWHLSGSQGPTFPCALCPSDEVGGDGGQHRAGAGGAHPEPPVRRRHRLLRVCHGAARQPAGRAAPQPHPRRQGQCCPQPQQGKEGQPGLPSEGPSLGPAAP